MGIITVMTESNGSGGKRLLRLRDGRMVAGVCAGIAAYLGVDVSLVRLGFGVLTVFYGLGALIYLTAWMVLPEEGQGGGSILQSFVNRLLTWTRRKQAPARTRYRFSGYAEHGSAGPCEARRPEGFAVRTARRLCCVRLRRRTNAASAAPRQRPHRLVA